MFLLVLSLKDILLSRRGAFKADPASAVVRAGAADDEERALLLRLLPGAHPEDEEPPGRRQLRGRLPQLQDVLHLRPSHGHHCHKETENDKSLVHQPSFTWPWDYMIPVLTQL